MLRLLFFIRECRFIVSVSVSMSGWWAGGGGGGEVGVGGCYQPGVYVPLKALFLVAIENNETNKI